MGNLSNQLLNNQAGMTMQSQPINNLIHQDQAVETAIIKNREKLQKHQQKIHELIDYFIGVKRYESENAIRYKRTQKDEQRLLWLLKITKEKVIEPLQIEYDLLVANHEK